MTGGGLVAQVAGIVALASLTAGASLAARDETPRIPVPWASDPYPSTYRPLPRVDTLIEHATILDGGGRRFDDADLLLRDGKVAAIGPHLRALSGVTIIDARGRWVTPGIIDPHSHNGDFPAPFNSLMLDHSDVTEIADPNSAEAWAEHSIVTQDPGFSRALAGGVTTLQILPGSSDLFSGRTVVLKNVPAATVQGMKFPDAQQGLKMACGENPEHQFGDKGRFPSSRMGNMAGYREGWIEAAQYRRDWQTYEHGERKDPPARDLKLDTLAAVLDGAIRVHMHCYRAEEMAYVLDMAKEFGFRVTAFHHAVEAYKIAPLLAKSGACAVVWSDWWGYKLEAFDAIRENAAFVDAAGGCVTMHSDSNVIGQRLTVEAGKAAAAGRRWGLTITPEHAIEWVTLNPARVLGLDDRIGSLEVGKNADVVVWSGDPFSIYTRADQVFIDGARVFDRFDPARRPKSDFEVGQPVTGTPP